MIFLALTSLKIVIQYNLQEIEHTGQVMVEIGKGMYGLPQAEIFANSNSPCTSGDMDTSQYHTPWAYGGTQQRILHPTLLSMILDLSN